MGVKTFFTELFYSMKYGFWEIGKFITFNSSFHNISKAFHDGWDHGHYVATKNDVKDAINDKVDSVSDKISDKINDAENYIQDKVHNSEKAGDEGNTSGFHKLHDAIGDKVKDVKVSLEHKADKKAEETEEHLHHPDEVHNSEKAGDEGNTSGFHKLHDAIGDKVKDVKASLEHKADKKADETEEHLHHPDEVHNSEKAGDEGNTSGFHKLHDAIGDKVKDVKASLEHKADKKADETEEHLHHPDEVHNSEKAGDEGNTSGFHKLHDAVKDKAKDVKASLEHKADKKADETEEHLHHPDEVHNSEKAGDEGNTSGFHKLHDAVKDKAKDVKASLEHKADKKADETEEHLHHPDEVHNSEKAGDDSEATHTMVKKGPNWCGTKHPFPMNEDENESPVGSAAIEETLLPVQKGPNWCGTKIPNYVEDGKIVCHAPIEAINEFGEHQELIPVPDFYNDYNNIGGM